MSNTINTMIVQIFLVIVCFHLGILVLSSSLEENYSIKKISVESEQAKGAAEFAVRELSKLSDSGIYTTISLIKIVSAEFQVGVFHENTILQLELGSQYFSSGNASEIFNFVVMKHKEDGVVSFAIDEFPVMNEVMKLVFTEINFQSHLSWKDAIELFYIQKVEQKRKKREESFRQLELDAYNMDSEGIAEENESAVDNSKMTDLDKQRNVLLDFVGTVETFLVLGNGS